MATRKQSLDKFVVDWVEKIVKKDRLKHKSIATYINRVLMEHINKTDDINKIKEAGLR